MEDRRPPKVDIQLIGFNCIVTHPENQVTDEDSGLLIGVMRNPQAEREARVVVSVHAECGCCLVAQIDPDQIDAVIEKMQEERDKLMAITGHARPRHGI